MHLDYRLIFRRPDGRTTRAHFLSMTGDMYSVGQQIPLDGEPYVIVRDGPALPPFLAELTLEPF